MEKFSTPQRATLPWIANLATLAVVVAAIGWSGGQRPDAPSTAAAAPASAVQTAPTVDHSVATHAGANQGRRTVQNPSRTINGLQVVGYTPGHTP